MSGYQGVRIPDDGKQPAAQPVTRTPPGDRTAAAPRPDRLGPCSEPAEVTCSTSNLNLKRPHWQARRRRPPGSAVQPERFNGSALGAGRRPSRAAGPGPPSHPPVRRANLNGCPQPAAAPPDSGLPGTEHQSAARLRHSESAVGTASERPRGRRGRPSLSYGHCDTRARGRALHSVP